MRLVLTSRACSFASSEAFGLWSVPRDVSSAIAVSSWKRGDLRLVAAQDSVLVFFGGHLFQCGLV